MSFCFPSFNYPSNINFCISKHTSQSQGKTKSSLLKLQSSIIPHTKGIENADESNRSFLLSKSSSDTSFIGIIGGISVDSSLKFAKKLVDLNLEEEESSPPFILCSDPTLKKELSYTNSDHSIVVENLRHKRVFLEKSGVCCIVMPCHISHCWHDETKEGCGVPFFHVGECVAKEFKEAKLRPLEAGSPLRIGVLATNETLVARLYQEKLENEGFEVVLLDKATMEHTVIPAVEALNRKRL